MLIIGLVLAVIYSDTLSVVTEAFPDLVPFIIAAHWRHFLNELYYRSLRFARGQKFSVIRSLPVDGKDILTAKLLFHQIFTAPFMVIGVAVLSSLPERI
jgi:hypothetical protein